MICIYLFNYLFIIREPTPSKAGSACIKPKERKARRGKKGKRIEVHRVKHPTPFQATVALTGDEEQNEKQKRTKINKQIFQ